jgi:hypothetical protein
MTDVLTRKGGVDRHREDTHMKTEAEGEGLLPLAKECRSHWKLAKAKDLPLEASPRGLLTNVSDQGPTAQPAQKPILWHQFLQKEKALL